MNPIPVSVLLRHHRLGSVTQFAAFGLAGSWEGEWIHQRGRFPSWAGHTASRPLPADGIPRNVLQEAGSTVGKTPASGAAGESDHIGRSSGEGQIRSGCGKLIASASAGTVDILASGRSGWGLFV